MKKLILLAALFFVFIITVNAQTYKKEDQMPDGSLTFSPNPVHEQLTIQFDNYCEYNLKWLITDFTGRIILNGTYPACQQMIQIETGVFQNGMYIFVITTPDDNIRKTIRFVKS